MDQLIQFIDQLSVQQGKDGTMISKKKYFGLVIGHTMVELAELDPQINSYATNSFGSRGRRYLVCDKLTIATKRALNSYIIPKRLAEIDILMNASIEMRLIKNLMESNIRSTKLLNNIFSGDANLHQFDTSELNDMKSVLKILWEHTEDMIVKSGPMVYFKGVNSLMAVDISDDYIRVKYLSDLTIKAIEKMGNTFLQL